jgi:hypothetical protein
MTPWTYDFCVKVPAEQAVLIRILTLVQRLCEISKQRYFETEKGSAIIEFTVTTDVDRARHLEMLLKGSPAIEEASIVRRYQKSAGLTAFLQATSKTAATG